MGATSSENYHSQKYLYAYQWGLGYNVKLLYQFKAFHYEGKCETLMVKPPLLHILPGQSRYHLMEYNHVIKYGPIIIGNSQCMSSTDRENIRMFLSTATLCLI